MKQTAERSQRLQVGAGAGWGRAGSSPQLLLQGPHAAPLAIIIAIIVAIIESNPSD